MAPRFRFEEFTVSPAERIVRRGGVEVPLIPRYFDLLVLLLEERHRAVTRDEILEAVWSDVVVSDGALSQAIRTLRRALGDAAREPVFIRTVSRHGYRFVHPGVIVENDALPPAPVGAPAPVAAAIAAAGDPFEPVMEQLLAGDSEGRLEAAEALHALGTDEALRRIERREGAAAANGIAEARAWMREARWAFPGAGEVPLFGRPGWAKAVLFLVGFRLRRGARLAGRRLGSAVFGGAVAGGIAGVLGGCVLRLGTSPGAAPELALMLGGAGVLIGGLGAMGVGAGLAFAEAIARSLRGPALVLCGALGGGLTGAVLHLLARSLLTQLFGQDVPRLAGGPEGLALGAAAGLGYALATPRPFGGGMATPRGARRFAVALATGVCCALAGVLVIRAGGNLIGTSLNLLADAYRGSQVGLTPMARLLGEAEAGPLTRGLSAGLEGLFFGAGLAYGLTRRPR
ncbi:MAG TPA: transcriptional regulator [Verrucomicrobiae bacterium]|nr:transcriptional regulator [Verrucomicrobiae bacterium]